MDVTDTHLILADGRRLGLSLQGPPGGTPLLYLHGTPGSRLEFRPPRALLEESGIQLIALERPGYGLSSPTMQPGLSAFADDVGEALGQLAVDRFHLIGFSGGAPYALACAARLGERVRGVLLAGALAPLTSLERLEGMNPLTREVYRVALSEPERLPGLLAPLAADVPGLAEQLVESLVSEDRAWLASGYGMDDFGANVAEGMRQGAHGVCHDILQLAAPWDFDLASVRQPVTLLHGQADCNVPPAHARLLAAALPDARLRLEAGHGHYVLFSRELLNSALLMLCR